MKPISDRPTAPVDTPDLELLRKFEPVVYYTKGEQFYPAAVEHYVKECSLWEHHPDGPEELLVPAGADDHGEIDRTAPGRLRHHPLPALYRGAQPGRGGPGAGEPGRACAAGSGIISAPASGAWRAAASCRAWRTGCSRSRSC